MQSLILLIAFAIIQTTANAQNWNQLGADINGEALGDGSGRSVSLSADGLTIAIGAIWNDGNGVSAGHVRVYKLLSGIWTQLGADIDGESAADDSGGSVSLSADGLTIAIGATENDGNGFNSGHVRVYKYLSGAWIQQGADIDGEEINDFSGFSVSLNADGTTIAIGSHRNAGNGYYAGHVRVYKWISGVWVQQGADIDGEAAGDQSGYSVSMSADGLTLAIGAFTNNGNGNSAAGHMRVYKFLSGIWTQQGADIDGEAAGDLSGQSVSLSADGLTVAIGAPQNSDNGSFAGHVRVYELSSGVWTQLGADIDGETANDVSGNSVSLSADGLTLAIGATENDENGVNAGHVRAYRFISGVWTQLGADTDGEAAGDRSGSSVSLNADGSILAVGAIMNGGNGTAAGHVRVYSFEDNIGIDENSPFYGISIFPNPTTQLVTIELGNLKDVTIQVFTIDGKLLYNTTSINTTTHQFELNEPPGVYFVELSSDGVSQRYQLVKE